MNYDTSLFPYDTVVRITSNLGQGSGVLISPDEVLTAAHVVWSSQYGAVPPSNIEVAPEFGGVSAPYGTYGVSSYHYFPIDDTRPVNGQNDGEYQTDTENDFAVLHLSQPFTGPGFMGYESNFPGGQVNVTGYPAYAGGLQENLPDSISQDPNFTIYNGVGLGPGSSGGPAWILGPNNMPYVVGLVSTGGGPGSAARFAEITSSKFDQINQWVIADDSHSTVNVPPPPPGPPTQQPIVVPPVTPPVATTPTPEISIFDASQNQYINSDGQPYSGPVQELSDQYINVTQDNLIITAASDGWFIHSGGGTDAIAVHGGRNVLDGGTGSNFLVGGTGYDTFFVDDRGAAAAIWSTIVNFHSGDDATIWGVTPSDFQLAWADNQGASGYTGLTLHASAPGEATASLTLPGFSQSDLSSGRLSVLFGTEGDSPYMYIHENS